MTTPTSATQILHAYRHLYKASLYAVRYSKPNRYIVRDAIRHAFRGSPATAFNFDKISRTLEFLEGAGRESGIESQILKSLCKVEHERKGNTMRRGARLHKKKMKPMERHLHDTAYDHYNNTIAMLNDSMGLCLPIH